MNSTIHVAGSGLVGTLTALVLGHKGFPVKLYERRPDPRQTEAGGGRSINLVITSRGLQAVRQVGLEEEIMALTIPMRGRMLHDTAGRTTVVPYGQHDHEVIHSISRVLLNNLLMDAVEKRPNIELCFEKRVESYDTRTGLLQFEDGEKVSTEVLIGADGSFSAIRRSMLDQMFNFNYSQSFLEHGYKELSIPATSEGEFAMAENYLHIWPRESYMLIALPNLDRSFTCTLFYQYQGFDALTTPQQVVEFFQRDFPDALDLMPQLTDEFFANPTGSLVTVRCQPWHVDGRACLIGDSAHAIVPFFGQGMNSGFEDCRVLGDLLGDQRDPDWSKLFADFEQARKVNAEAIADMALENFVEMRDSTADPVFQLKKKIGFELETRFPGRFIPRYSMVMFHPDIPYAEARRLSEIQAGILTRLCQGVTSIEQVDWKLAESLLDQHFGK